VTDPARRFDPGPRFDPGRFMARFEGIGHGGAIGIVYRAHGEDWAELGLPYSENLIGVRGIAGVPGEPGVVGFPGEPGGESPPVIASGPIISLMDMATSLAVWTRMGIFRAQATLDMRVDYLRPAGPERDIVGRGECYSVKKRIAFVRGIAHDGDATDPIAYVSGTFMFTD